MENNEKKQRMNETKQLKYKEAVKVCVNLVQKFFARKWL